MVNRRLLLFAALLLFVGSIAGALTPRKQQDAAPIPPPARVAPLVRVSATLPGATPVRARVGDLVSLRVNSAKADQAEIAGLGLSEPVGVDLMADFTFVADRPGRFPVRLSLADEEVGAVEVRR